MEAIAAMTMSFAPNLKEICLRRDIPGSCPALTEAWEVVEQELKGAELEGQGPSRPARLTTLALSADDGMERDLRYWHREIDFAELRTLKLHTYLPLETLRWLTNLRPFSDKLEELAFELSSQEIEEGSDDALENFLGSLCPLRRLRLPCPYTQGIWGALFRRHGDSLRSLLLDDIFDNSTERHITLDAATLSDIRHGCPNLQKLAVPITRSTGDENETACYRAIGSFPHLRDLTLNLHVHNVAPNAAPNQINSQENLRNALIHCAIDASLAAAIFRLISSTHGSLENLRLLVRIDRIGLASQYLSISRMLAGWWHCERDRRDTAPRHSCFTTKLEAVDAGEYGHAVRRRTIHLGLESAWRGLWPDMRSGDWRQDWHSMPLQDADV